MVRLLVYFAVAKERRESFEAFYSDSYLPLLRQQRDFVSTSLGAVFAEDVLSGIGAEVPADNYCLTIEFESEAARRAWVASPEHDPAWSQITSLTEKFWYTGYDIVAEARTPSRDHERG